MEKSYRVILIDPEARSVRMLQWDGSLDELHRLVGAEVLDHFKMALSNSGHSASGWVDDGGLSNGKPVHAFLLPILKTPIAGKCVIVGSDARGETADCFLPLELLQRDVEWLGVIKPEVTWDRTEHGDRAIVTYSRVKQ